MNWKVIYFGIAYSLIFSGYYLITSFLNIIYESNAFISFAIFYAIYAVFSLVAPFILYKLNYKLALFLSSLTFVLFIAGASSQSVPFMLVSSGFAGLGNSVIWLIQGAWLSMPDNNNTMGIFFALFGTNIIVSNILALIVLLSGVSVSMMMWLMLIPTGIGCLMTLIIPFNNDNSNNTHNTNFLKMLKGIFIIAFDKRKGYLLILLMMAQAIGLNVTYQLLPRMLINNANMTNTNNFTDTNTVNDISGPIYNVITFLAYGVSSIPFSFIWAKLYIQSWKLVLIPYLILELLCLIGMLLLGLYNSNGPLGYWIIIGFFRGIIDFAINNALNIMIAQEYKSDSNLMFGQFRSVYAVSYVVFSVCIGYLNYEWVLLICGIFAISSVISVCFFFQINKKSELENQFDKSSIKV